MTVGRLGVEMSSDEFTGWHAYDAFERRRREDEESQREAEQRTREPVEDAE